jgi:hypothetical protein
MHMTPQRKQLLDDLAAAMNALENEGLSVGPLLPDAGYGLCVDDKDEDGAYHFKQQDKIKDDSWDWTTFVVEEDKANA